MAKKSVEQMLEQNAMTSNDNLKKASQLFQEAWELQKQVPIWDNYDLSGISDEAAEALKKQAEMLQEVANQKFAEAQEKLSTAQEQKEWFNPNFKNREKPDLFAQMRSKLNFSEKIHDIALDIRDHMKETFQSWKEAVELTGQKLETIKDHAVEYRQAVTNANKVEKSIKAQDKTFNMDIKMLEAEKQHILEKMRINEMAVRQLNDKTEVAYERAMRQNERAYSLELMKAGMTGIVKNMFGAKEEVLPPVADFSTPKEPIATHIKEMQDYSIAIVKENRQLEEQLRKIERKMILKSILHGNIERPAEISKEEFNKATVHVREALVRDMNKEFIFGKVKEEQLEKFEELANQKDEHGNPAFDVEQLHQIKIGLEKNQDIERFAEPELSAYKMSIIRGLDEHGIDLTQMQGMDANGHAIIADLDKTKMIEMNPKELAEAAAQSIERHVKKDDFVKDMTDGEIDTQTLMQDCYDSLMQTRGQNEPERESEIVQAFYEGAREVSDFVEQKKEDIEVEREEMAPEVDVEQEFDDRADAGDRDDAGDVNIDEGMDI